VSTRFVVQPPPLHGPWPDLRPPRWRGPSRPPAPAAAWALLGAAAIAALSLPLDRAGVGWLIAAVAATAALVGARRATANAGPAPLTSWAGHTVTLAPERYGWTVATIALLGVGTVRAAGWLFALCLLAALVTTTFAVAGGRSVRALLWGVVVAPAAAVKSLGWLRDGLRRHGGTPRMRIAATVAVSVALLVVFGALFAAADPAFADLLRAVLPDLSTDTAVRWTVVLGAATAALGGAAYLRAAPAPTADLEVPRYRPVRRLEWLVPLVALDLLFAAFLLVQATVLFGGGQHVLRTAGLTYAEHARGGFWQLLIVTVLTLLVLAGAVRWAPRSGPADRVLIRVLLGLLATFTLLVVASALFRMTVYAEAYGLTRLRLLVFACEIWLGVVFVLVLVAGIRLRAAWLPQAAVATGVLALLGLAALNPDGLIAGHNLKRGQLDVSYLEQLSADAVPALDAAPRRDCLLIQHDIETSTEPDDWRSANLARARAREILAARPIKACRDR
jgi:hypothetical protein